MEFISNFVPVWLIRLSLRHGSLRNRSVTPGLSSTLTSSQMEDWDLSYLGIPLRTKLQRFSSLTAEPTLTLLVRTWDIQRAYSVEIDFLFIL